MVGNTYGRLVVIARAGSKQYGAKLRALWLCRCECGEFTTQPTISLTTGHTTSCGCLRVDAPARLKHGHAKNDRRSQAYRTWVHLRNRSYNRVLVDYDPRWNEFEVFLADMGEPPASNLELDRKDNNKGYSKENCRWVTRLQNVRNRSNTLKINGVPFAEIAESVGVNYDSLYYRVFLKGMPIMQAIIQAREVASV